MTERLSSSAGLAYPAAAFRSVRSWLARYGMVVVLPILLGLGGVISPAFLSADNISNLLLQFAPLAIVAMARALS